MERQWLHRCAVLLAVCAFLSVCTGTAVTTNEERPFYSAGQSHMWFGIATGILLITVAVWLRSEERAWLRWLGRSTLAAMIFQAALGYEPLPQSARVRIAHTGIAQLMFPATLVLAVCTSRAWNRPRQGAESSSLLRVLAHGAPVAVLAQVALGTLFRHGALGIGLHLAGAFVIAFVILGVTLPLIYDPAHASLHA